MDQGLSIRRTVHLRLQVQMQMKSTGAFYAYEKQLSSRGATPYPRLSAEEPEAAADFVLANDGRGVAVADAVLVGKPVGALFTAQEGRTGFNTSEPLSKVTTRDAGYAGNQIFVRLQGASQRQLAPPGAVDLLL